MTSKTTVITALRRLNEIHDDLLALPGVTGAGVGGTEDDAELQVFCNEGLADDTLDVVAVLADGVAWRMVPMSVPEAEPSTP